MPTSGLSLYRLRTAAAMAPLLRELHRQAVACSLYAADGQGSRLGMESSVPEPHSPFGMACVAALQEDGPHMALKMSAPILPLPAQAWAVAHMQGGVRVQWQVQGEWSNDGGPHWQLQMPWPEEVQLLQRRRHPRVHVPLGQNYSARFMFGRKVCTLDIDDLSAGGVALRGTRQETAMLFMGRVLPHVSLHLSDALTLQVALKVRSRRRYQSFLLGEQVLVGCSVEAMADEDRAALLQHLSAQTGAQG